MKHALGPMLKQQRGVIVNTAALAGIICSPLSPPAYSAAKAGVIHLTMQAASFYTRHGIRVNCVSPRLGATEQLIANCIEAEIAEMARMTQPGINRAPTPKEVADGYLWHYSDGASGVTGMSLRIDGGGYVAGAPA